MWSYLVIGSGVVLRRFSGLNCTPSPCRVIGRMRLRVPSSAQCLVSFTSRLLSINKETNNGYRQELAERVEVIDNFFYLKFERETRVANKATRVFGVRCLVVCVLSAGCDYHVIRVGPDRPRSITGSIWGTYKLPSCQVAKKQVRNSANRKNN